MTSTSLCDDPDKLLNEWLGELENLIGVSSSNHFFFILYKFHSQKYRHFGTCFTFIYKLISIYRKLSSFFVVE